MKLLIFIIILLALYYIATQIKVVHINTLPEKQKNELTNKNKIRDMLKTSYIKSADDAESQITTEKFKHNIDPIDYFVSNKTENFNNIIDKIKFNFVDNNFIFNLPNLPVTKKKIDTNQYDKYIIREISLWKRIYPEIYIVEVLPIDILQTRNEFLLRVNVEISFLDKNIYLQTVFYGKIIEQDDILRDHNKYNLQLASIRKIEPENFNKIITDDIPFLTMKQQMEYVSKINKMHEEE